MSHYPLPKDEADLANALDQILGMAKDNVRARTVMWMVNWMYIQGIRRFRLINFESGELQVTWGTKDGKIPFKYPGALKNYEAEMGRLLQMDAAPLVNTKGGGLTSHRDKSLSQITLDTLVCEEDQQLAKREIITLLLIFGTAGLAPSVFGDPMGGHFADLEVVPPWELTPIPHNPYHHSGAVGVSRDRLVPLKWLEDKYDKRTISSAAGDRKLSLRNLPFGHNQRPVDTEGGGGREGDTRHRDEASSEPRRKEWERAQTWAHFHEAWITGRRRHLTRYIARCGQKILRDETFDESLGERMAISVSRYGDTGCFYGQSWLDLQVGLNREAEKLMGRLFENVSSLSRYGILVVPADMGDPRTTFQNTDHDLLVMYYEPSQYAPSQRPTVLSPATSGTLPGETAAFAVNELNRMSQDSTLENLPARTDSPNAIAMIDEVNRRPVIAAQDDIARQFSAGYRWIVEHADEFYMQRKPVFLTEIDDNVAGIRIDMEGGAPRLMLETAQKPSTEGLRFQIRGQDSRGDQVKKAEVIQLMQLQAISPVDLPILNHEKRLGFILPETPEFNTYLTTMLNNILLFNDGQIPGQVFGSGLVDNPMVAMKTVARFMTRPIFKLASREVRQSFEQMFEAYKLAIVGPRLGTPNQPQPENIIEQAEASQPRSGGASRSGGANLRIAEGAA